MNHAAIINIAKAQLGLDEGDYRSMLSRVTGKASLRLMSGGEKTKVVDELKRLGFKVAAKSNQKRKAAARADVRYCHVIWRLLVDGGAMNVKGAKGLNAFIRARFERTWGCVPIDIDTMTDAREISQVIEALKKIAARHGIATETGGCG